MRLIAARRETRDATTRAPVGKDGEMSGPMNNPLRTSFRLRLTFMALLASVPAMLGAHMGISHVAAELLRADARRQLAATADTLSRNVRQWDRSMALALRTMTAEPDVVSMDPARQR